MSELVLTIRHDADRDAILRDLDAAGIRWEGLESLQRTLFVHGLTLEAFPLRDHPAILAVEDGDVQVRQHVSQEIVFDIDREIAGWPLLRHTSRDLPWSLPLRYPFSGVYECARDGTGVDVYMCDSGVRSTHVEFAGKPIGVVYEASTESVLDVTGHGTLCMSAAVGATCGFARGANFFSARYHTGGGGAAVSNISRALDAILTHWKGRSALDTPGVVNMSFGGSTSSLASNAAECAAAGLILCAAAGNEVYDLRRTPIGPALTERVLTVGGCNASDGTYLRGINGSNYSDQIDVLIGSQDTWIARNDADDSYGFSDGTSPGCGHMTGVVACMLQGYRRGTTEGHVMRLQQYVRDQATYGRLKRHPRQPTMRDGIAFLDPRPIDQVLPIPGWVRR